MIACTSAVLKVRASPAVSIGSFVFLRVQNEYVYIHMSIYTYMKGFLGDLCWRWYVFACVQACSRGVVHIHVLSLLSVSLSLSLRVNAIALEHNVCVCVRFV